jgi:ABC-type Zn2+ transport system substrate-binding protein/surface adhesin
MIADIPDRKISRETAKKYNVQIKKKGHEVTHHIYQYFDERW